MFRECCCKKRLRTPGLECAIVFVITLFVFQCECFTVPLKPCELSVAGGQSDQGYDSLSKEEVRIGGGEEQDSSPHLKEKKERDSIPGELCIMFFSSAGVSYKVPPSGVVWHCRLLYNNKMFALSC